MRRMVSLFMGLKSSGECNTNGASDSSHSLRSARCLNSHRTEHRRQEALHVPVRVQHRDGAHGCATERSGDHPAGICAARQTEPWGTHPHRGPPLAGIQPAGGGVFHDHRRSHDRQCRPPHHRSEASLSRVRSAVGGHRLRVDLRWLPPPRRSGRRPPGPPAPPHGGSAHIHLGFSRLWPGHF